MSTYIKLVIVVACAAILSSCAHISDDARLRLRKPVNCEKAREDITALEIQKASVAKRMLSAWTNTSVVTALVTIFDDRYEEYEDGIKVATGQYNDEIDVKISDIKYKCGLYD